MKRLWFLLTDGLPRLAGRLLDDLRSGGRMCRDCDRFVDFGDGVGGRCKWRWGITNRTDCCRQFILKPRTPKHELLETLKETHT